MEGEGHQNLEEEGHTKKRAAGTASLSRQTHREGWRGGVGKSPDLAPTSTPELGYPIGQRPEPERQVDALSQAACWDPEQEGQWWDEWAWGAGGGRGAFQQGRGGGQRGPVTPAGLSEPLRPRLSE